MKSKGSLPHSQEPATCSCTEADQSSLCHPFHFSKVTLILSSIYAWVFQVVSFTQVLPSKTQHARLLSHIRATCTAHLSLGLVTRVIFGEEYRTQISFPTSFSRLRTREGATMTRLDETWRRDSLYRAHCLGNVAARNWGRVLTGATCG
jgi:hypothetical protein